MAESNNSLAINCSTSSSHYLGGLNLKAYCQALGATNVAVIDNEWTCYGQSIGRIVINMHDACLWAYSYGAYNASPRGNHLIVNCFR